MALSPISRRTALHWMSASAAAAVSLRSAQPATAAEVPRVLPAGQLPKDARLGDLKDLNGYFPWTPSPTAAEWEQRAADVRRQILVACGLWPMPARPAIQATISGKIERDDYTVEKVFFESHTGLYVTGSLYRPLKFTGKRPGVLCPHGHWENGRFFEHKEAAMKLEIEKQAESDPVAGRSPLQARCVQLARMGCVVFLYDMLGYADNQTLSFELIHRFGKQRPEFSSPEHWGLFSAQSELRLLSALGMQTWNSIRALDWFETLPDVDATRIGVTGASGGGTQTFLLGAVDSRPVAFFPAVMVSTSMQGGCTCENASYLRVGTGNIEFAAMAAPRVLGMSAANDWTRELETKGLPELQQHYKTLGVPERVTGKYFPFEHNYNQTSRAMMYGIFREALGLGEVSTEERAYQPLTREEASVWTAEHPAPPTGDDAEWKVMKGFADEFDQQLASLTPKDAASLETYRQVIGGGWDVLLGRSLKTAGPAVSENLRDEQHGDYFLHIGVVRNPQYGEEIPVITCGPANWNRQLVLWLTDQGKQGLFDADGRPAAGVRKLLDAGYAVVGADLLQQGEFLTPEQPQTQTRWVNNPREFLGYVVGYNHPLFSQRVHDVLSLIRVAQTHPMAPTAIHLAGTGGAALYAAAAAVQAGDAVQKLVLETGGYRFASITEIRDPLLLPGAVRYGDVPGLLALRAPFPAVLIGESADTLGLTTAAYAAAGRADQLTLAASWDEALAPLIRR